jgi:hypothetical protein
VLVIVKHAARLELTLLRRLELVIWGLLCSHEVSCLPWKLRAAGIGRHFKWCQVFDVFIEEHSVVDVIWGQLLLIILIKALEIIVQVIMSKDPMQALRRHLALNFPAKVCQFLMPRSGITSFLDFSLCHGITEKHFFRFKL